MRMLCPSLQNSKSKDGTCNGITPAFGKSLTRRHGVPEQALIQINVGHTIQPPLGRPDRGRRCGRRDRKSHLGVPARGLVFGGKFPVGLEVEITLHVADRKSESNLRTDTSHLRTEAADTIARTAVATKLLVDVAHQANLNLLGQE